MFLFCLCSEILLRESSFNVRGPRLFNKLPDSLRNITMCKVENFKSKLDKYLSTIPDKPLVNGYQKFSANYSNSIVDF